MPCFGTTDRTRGAEAAFRTLLDVPSGLLDIQRWDLTVDLLSCSLLLGRSQEELAPLRTPALLHYCKATRGTTERNWVMLFKQYENVEELNRRVLMSLVDRILIHENHAIEIVFKYRDEYQQTLEYILGYADELDIAV